MPTYLDDLVPATGHNDGNGGVRGEANARHPITVTFILDGILAYTKGIPQLHSLVSRSRNDLPVVWRESNAQHIIGVSVEVSRRLLPG